MKIDKDFPHIYSAEKIQAKENIEKIIRSYDDSANTGYKKVESVADLGFNVKVNLKDHNAEQLKKDILDKHKDYVSQIYSHSSNNFTIYFK